jgi:hypothetical protein
MKLRVTMKDPDCLHEAVDSAVARQLKELNLPDDECDAIREMRCEKLREECSKWFEYGEYLTVEIDTDAGTCVVVPR